MQALKQVDLGFGQLYILKTNLAEVVIDEGIEMDLLMVDHYHDALLAELIPPFDIIINKINAYTYSFEAQMKIGTLEEINRLAIVTYNRISQVSTENLATFPRDNPWKMKLFAKREFALNWLAGK